ncbi:LOW QUALITY PROTEIN: coiled-coil domain-containing protein 158 [Mesoplodon densirostris]|uniref:LOW QUALITY PROTEIN: coiled-coil domain-containing protein 158 n=1 Tax=Mesoplodon densirostris TaxID=48708 RepID=UPI0028DB866A|nr:LOW QUALITY PROTEIN: coiled-coil domain-containing protein 158 [Mesoplodon densirostris]
MGVQIEEKQLVLANSELMEARTERDQFSQESGNPDYQLQKFLATYLRFLYADLHKREKELSLKNEQNKCLWDCPTGNSIIIDHLLQELGDRNMEVQRLEALLKAMKSECQGQKEWQMAAIQGKNESLEEVSSLTAQLEATKDVLHKVVEELTAKKLTLESSERTVSDLTTSLQEKERAIEATNSEIVELGSWMDLKLQELQLLKNEVVHLRNVQVENEYLKLQMAEKDEVNKTLQQQIEDMMQPMDQDGPMADAVRVEKAHLKKKLNDTRLELQEVKILNYKKVAEIRELEARVCDLELEKVKLVNAGSEWLCAVKDLKQERVHLLSEVKASSELNNLTEDYEVLKRNFQNKREEMETTTNKLKMQVKSSHSEVEQIRNAVKPMEGSDGHGMKVAMGMQKQITARRGQIDALQSKTQVLEEAMVNRKKASLQFAKRQDIVQRWEQEPVRLNLQHTLDVKELKGPGYTSNSSVKPCLLQPSFAAHSHSYVPSSQSAARFLSHVIVLIQHCTKPNTKEYTTRDLKQLIQELRSMINGEPPVPLGKSEEDGRAPSLAVSYVAVDDRIRDCITESSLRLEICHRSNNSLRESTEGSKSDETLSRPLGSMSSMIRNQEKRIHRVKDQEKKLLKGYITCLSFKRASSPAPLPILEIRVWHWKLQASDHLVYPVTSPSLRLSRGPI